MVKESERRYWLDLFTGTTWAEFLRSGAAVSGFRETRWPSVKQLRQGDYLICYLTGLSRWIGVLEVTGEPFLDHKNRIWDLDQFPARVPVKLIAQLQPSTAVPILGMQEQLSIFKNATSPSAWTGAVRASPAQWKMADGEAVVAAIFEAVRNPVERPVDERKLKKVPPIYKAKAVGTVTIPENDDQPLKESVVQAAEGDAPIREHLEIQIMLLTLGSDMGLDVWAARNDRSRVMAAAGGRLKSCLTTLPLHFDDATNLTIELIDVLWLKGKTIVAAFEIESTTSIYSGLLRMSDLIAMQPNLNIPLFLVAPDERRDKVMQEINRPTFSRLSPPMTEMCRFVPFSDLREKVRQAGDLVRYLRPEFLDEIAETCELPED